MDPAAPLDIFLVAPPGFEPLAAEEARTAGFADAAAVPGGVALRGGWPEVWRANLLLRGTTRVLVRLAAFRAPHLAQLDRRTRRLPWAAILRPDVPVRIEARCRGSRIWHAGAAAQRLADALRHGLGAEVRADAPLTLKLRVEDDLCTISLDSSGTPLHRRGHKQAVGKAPLRETLAALVLRACGYDGREPVLDPMCGSGTLPIEAAEIAAGLAPGRARSFAFELLASHDPAAFAALRVGLRRAAPPAGPPQAFGSDRDAGAVAMAAANADRAGVAALCAFRRAAVSDLAAPDGPPGLVIVNPPYGGRIGDARRLPSLYGALGTTLVRRFAGWRVGLVTADAALAHATGLPFGPPGPRIDHGGIPIRLWRTGPLA